MGLFSRIFAGSSGEKRDYKANRSPILTIPGLNDDGVEALGSPALWAGVSLIANSVASLPWKVYSGAKDRLRDIPIAKILERNINPAMTSFTYKQKIMLDLLLDGNTFSWQGKSPDGKLLALFPLNPKKMRIEYTTGKKTFYTSGGYKFPDGEVIHIPGLSKDGISGLSVLTYHADTFATSFSIRKFFRSFFKNAAVPSGVLKTDKGLSQDAIEKLKMQFREQYAGVENMHKFLVLEEGLSYQAISLNSKDAELIESGKLNDLQILQILGVPPSLVGYTDKASYNTLEAQNVAFLLYTMSPWLRRIENGLNSALFPDSDNFIEIDTNAFLRPTTKERYEAYQIGFKLGMWSPNDLLKFENQPPSDQQGMDLHYIEANNMQPIGAPRLQEGK